MNEAVVAGSITVAALNLAAGLDGFLAYYLGDPSSTVARLFWLLLRIGQGAALTLAVAVGSLAAAGNYSSDRLFYLYSLLPLAIAMLAEQLRATSAQAVLDRRGLDGSAAVAELPEGEQQTLVAEIVHREIATMAASAVVVVFLALRAAGTAHGF